MQTIVTTWNFNRALMISELKKNMKLRTSSWSCQQKMDDWDGKIEERSQKETGKQEWLIECQKNRW